MQDHARLERNLGGFPHKPVHARICRTNAGDQDRDAQFVRACGVEMHLDKSQEPFYANLQEKIHTSRSCTICAILRKSKCTWTSRKSNFIFCAKLPKKMPRPKIGAHSLRRPAQVEMHLDKPRTVCASLRSRNALGQVTKAILRENLQEKNRVPKWRGRLSGDCATETHMDIAEQEKCRGPDGAP